MLLQSSGRAPLIHRVVGWARRLTVAGALLLAATLAAGCSGGALVVGGGAPHLIDGRHLPPLSARLLWQGSYPGSARLSLAPDGSVMAVQAGGSLVAVDPASGRVLYRVPAAGFFQAVGAGLVLTGPAGSGAPGPVALLGPAGQRVWRAAGEGPFRVALSPDGSRVAVEDEGRGTVVVLAAAPPAGRVLARFPVTTAAQIAFTGNNRLLVDEGSEVFFVRPDGSRRIVCTACGGPVRHDAVASGGQWLAVATGTPDDTLYLFGPDGHSIWHRPLLAGGENRLAAAPGDHLLVAYDIGPAGDGVLAVSPSDGREVWSLSSAYRNGEAPTVTGVGFTGTGSGGATLLVEQGASRARVDAVGDGGVALGSLDLPRVRRAEVAGSRALVAAVGPVADGGSQVAVWTLPGLAAPGPSGPAGGRSARPLVTD